MALLSRPLRIFDIDDAEAYCAKIVYTSRLGLQPHDDYDDLLAHCLGACWEISLRYDPSRGKFSSFAYGPVYFAAVNWVRKRKGRTRWQFSGGRVHERKQPQLLSLDDEHSRLGEVESLRNGDRAPDRDESLAWLFDAGNRGTAADLELLGLEASSRTS
jgi:DNA-directed RNA polymerase specialized sigma24 family protein